MAPYVIALAVLAGLGRSTKLPAAIGQPLQSD
jgi:simple sugar transport system permease protein